MKTKQYVPALIYDDGSTVAFVPQHTLEKAIRIVRNVGTAPKDRRVVYEQNTEGSRILVWENAKVKTQARQINELASEVYLANHKWWHDKDGNRVERNRGELLCLIHSEISEAMEGERKGLMDDKLTHRKMAEVELADAMIRILDYSAGFGYDLGGALVEKLEYNRTRHDHTHEAREAEGGKKW